MAVSNTTKRSDALAWTLILGSAALCLLAFIGLSKFGERYFGPQSVALSPSNVWIFSQAKLWRLTHGGEVTGAFESSSLGGGHLVDMLAALDDEQVLLHDFRRNEWRHCRIGARDGVEPRCEPLFRGGEEGRNSHRGAIAVAPDRSRWVFADFDTGEVLLLDPSRGVVAKAKGLVSQEAGVALWFPDQTLGLIPSDQSSLYLASVANDGIAPFSKHWSLQREGKNAGGYVWSAAYDPEGRRWLLAHGSVRRATHRLWEVDDKGAQRSVLSLDCKGEPAQIAFLARDTALVPDVVGGQVHRVELSSGRIDAFGDARFRAALAQGQERFNFIERASFGAIIALFAVPILIGLFFVVRDDKRAAVEIRNLPTPAAIDGDVWLGLDPKWESSQRRFVWGFAFVLVCLLAAQILFMRDYFGKGPYMVMLALVVVVIAVSFWGVDRTRKAALARRLGVTEGAVLYDHGDGKVGRFPFAEVITDGKRLLFGKRMLPIAIPSVPLPWRAEDVRDQILARLPASSWVSASKLEMAMYRRNPAAMALAIATVLILLAVVVGGPRLRSLVKSGTAEDAAPPATSR